jgi:phosphoesterase RecJ-like protein
VTVDLGPWLGDVPAATSEAIRTARSILVASHENPDADTLGAAIGIAAIADALGATTTLVCSDPPPPLYGFLAGIDRVRLDPDPGATYDRLVVVDCGTLDRVGAVRERHRTLFDGLSRAVVDHHRSNDAAGPADWVDPEAAATCEMVALLAVRLGVPLTARNGELAAALMAGIVMDTATFAHPNATPRTLAVAAALVEAGAPLSEISRRLYRSKPDAQLRLFGRVLDRMATASRGRIVHSAMLVRDLPDTGAIAPHGEGIIDLLAQSETADVAILFKEVDDHTTRVSVRTKPEGVDATVLTGAFGGGGHARAAGATVEASLDEARRRVVLEAERLLDTQAR